MTELAKPASPRRFQKSHDLARRALALAARYETAADPVSFALWYTYAGGSTPALNAAVDAMLAERDGLSRYDINVLHETHIAKSSKHDEQVEKLGDGFEREMRHVMQLVADSLASNRTYSAALGDTQGLLPEDVTPEQVREVISSLIAENEKARAQADSVSDGLKKSSAEILQLNEQLTETREEQMKDPQTGLLSRRGFDMRLDREFENAMRNGNQLSLILAEIDDIRATGESHGAAVADGVMQTFAALLLNNIKGQDIAARYSETEVAIILPRTNLQGAAQLTKRLVTELDGSWMVIKNTGEALGKISASFGISMLRPGTDTAYLLARAEAKLQAAQQSGGGCIKIDLAATNAA